MLIMETKMQTHVFKVIAQDYETTHLAVRKILNDKV